MAEYEPGVVLVTLPAGISPAQAVATIADETGIEGLALANEDSYQAPAATAAETPALVELSVPGEVTVEDAVALIGASSAIESVQPNFVYHLSDSSDPEESVRNDLVAQNLIAQNLVAQVATVDDANIDKQWELESIYAHHVGTASDDNAEYAWDSVRSNNAVGVAIIDEGFEAAHPDLKDNVKLTYDAVTGSGDVSEISGEGGHGTHVAGIVAATANNGQGVAGVSYNANLLLVKGASAKSGKASFNTASVVAAFDYIIGKKSAYNIRVINMSVATGTSMAVSRWGDDELIKAIDRATAAGIVVVCSAGNRFTDSNGTTWTPPYTCYPADYANVVSVMNLKQSGSEPHAVSLNKGAASASNYNASASSHSASGGGKVSETGKNISAPGTSIYSTLPGGSYGYKTGTSMASPVVAGALALAFAANPSLTASQATSLLYTTATDLAPAGWDAETGYGEVNAYGLVSNAGSYLSGGTMVQKGKTITFTVSSGAGNVVWATSDSSVATVSGGVVTGVSGGEARITAGRVVSAFGSTSVIPIGSQVVTVYDPAISPSSVSVTVGNTATLTMNCSQSGAWNWTSSDASVASVTKSGTTVTVSGKKAGTATITATLNSNSDISITAKVTVNALSLAGATVSWPAATYTYNGSVQKPTPTVKVGSITLDAGIDFTVTYPGDCTNAGTKTVTIKPGSSGRCAGSKSASYVIERASISTATVTPPPGEYDYDGKAKTPSVTVKLGSRTLSQGTDYTVSYANNVNPGTATATVAGSGNYTGSKSANFTIISTAAVPSVSGATRVPVGATAAFSVTDNGSIAIKSGGSCATLSGKTLTGTAAGTVTLSIRDSNGAERDTRTVEVYALDGTWELQSAMKSNMVLDIYGAGISNSANMIIWPRNGGANQRFKFTRVGSTGYYTLAMVHSGKMVDVYGGGKNQGARVIQWPSHGGANQQWSMAVDSSNYVTLTSRNSGLVLDVYGAQAVNGRQVIQWSLNGGANQKWLLVKHSNSSALAEGGYRISAGSTSFCLDVSGNSGSNGANVALWTRNGQGNQRFQAIDLGGGLVRLQAYHSGQVLDVSGAAYRAGQNVLQWPWTGGNNQKWKPVRNSDGTYSFLCAGNQKFALTWSGNARAGANLQIGAWTDASNQRFSAQQL